MSDGTRLSATLYLPDGAGPDQRTPCLLEALPYRKDDLTSSYRPEYDELRDTYGYAVCRARPARHRVVRGRCRPTSTPRQEQADLAEVIAWLAEQPWCSGAVGMFGTSYSGFNSLQMAAERPPALKAICAIYAIGRPLHRRRPLHGRAAQVARPGRLLPLHDADERPAADARALG